MGRGSVAINYSAAHLLPPFRLAVAAAWALAVLASAVLRAQSITYTSNQVNSAGIDTTAPNNPSTLSTPGLNATQSGVITGSGAIIKSGSGNLTLTATNDFTGGTTVSAGLINFAALANFGSGNITISSGAGLQWATSTTTDVSGRLNSLTGETIFNTNGNNVTFASALAGGGSAYVTKTGSGTLTLAGRTPTRAAPRSRSAP